MRQQKAETVERVSNLALYCMVEVSGVERASSPDANYSAPKFRPYSYGPFLWLQQVDVAIF